MTAELRDNAGEREERTPIRISLWNFMAGLLPPEITYREVLTAERARIAEEDEEEPEEEPDEDEDLD